MALGENHPDVCNGHHLEARTQMDLRVNRSRVILLLDEFFFFFFSENIGP